MARAKKRAGPSRSSRRKYGPRAQKKVARAMHEMKRGTLKSGRSGKKVKNPRQAVAIGLAEARRAGAKVPPAPKRSRSKKKGGSHRRGA